MKAVRSTSPSGLSKGIMSNERNVFSSKTEAYDTGGRDVKKLQSSIKK